ncbi:MAG: recombinase RecA [Parcubacteria group bacterium]|nr:recombinase RecA [Parcubacteria group bacterium]
MAKKSSLPKTKENEDNLEGILKDLRDKFGEGSIMRLGEVRKVDVDVIPTGSPSLDLALGVGGVPRGRIIEIYGAESSGKTTLVLHIIAEVQKRGGKAAFIDSEHALDPEYAEKIGVKVKDLLISQPDNGEQALDIAEALVRSGSIDLIVIDSVAALTPKVEIEGEMGDQYIGLQARLMSQALRKLTAITSKANTAIIFTNQTRAQIGMMMFGNPITTPGGKALKFYASVRIELKRIAQIKKGDQIIGSRVKAKVVKNKVAAPFKEAEFDIIYNVGIAYENDLLNLATKLGIIQKAGMTYNFGEIKLGASFDKATEFLKSNPSVAKEILKQINLKTNQ